jgi:UDP-2,4-diacetamido-2,4,6-trideoxy-beta-L-altropyranose hydrolase
MSSAPQVAIRTDASSVIGAGHVMRCLTLAEELRGIGFDISFVCRVGDGDGIDIINNRGFRTHAREDASDWRADADRSTQALSGQAPIDWIVVDHYGLDWRWESHMRGTARHILVIDDLANRNHDCEVLLDQNFYAGAARRYEGRVPAACQLFLGPAFALLRNEFREAARRPRERSGCVRRLLVTFGATDPTDETGKVLAALRSLTSPVLEADVVVGVGNQRREQIEAQCDALRGVRCHVQTSRMAELMWNADLAIGAGGATTWERCVLGLPALTVVIAPNQLQTTTDLADAGAIRYLGRAEDLAANDYEIAIRNAMNDAGRLQALSARSRAIMGPVSAILSSAHHPVVDAMQYSVQHT